MRSLLFPALLGLAIALAPAAQACHPSGGVLVATGALLGPQPMPATLRFGTCEGLVDVEVRNLDGRVVDRFQAVLDILAPADAECIFGGGCGGLDPPAALFRLAGPGAADLVGASQNLHWAAGHQLAGQVRVDAAVFAAAGA